MKRIALREETSIDVNDGLLVFPGTVDRVTPPRAEPAAYARIEEELAERIRGGSLRPGDRLPPERELAAQMGVSRMTVRQALGRLADRGLLAREQGRGTFVSAPKMVQSLSRLHGLYEQMLQQGILPAARLISGEQVAATAALARALDVRMGMPLYKLVRLRLGTGLAVALETSYFPVRLVPGLLDHDLERLSIYRLMEDYGARPVRAVQSLEPVLARADEAAALEVAVGSPLMLVERTAWDERGRTVEYAKDLYRGDRNRFVGEMYLERTGDGGRRTEDGGRAFDR